MEVIDLVFEKGQPISEAAKKYSGFLIPCPTLSCFLRFSSEIGEMNDDEKKLYSVAKIIEKNPELVLHIDNRKKKISECTDAMWKSVSSRLEIPKGHDLCIADGFKIFAVVNANQ